MRQVYRPAPSPLFCQRKQRNNPPIKASLSPILLILLLSDWSLPLETVKSKRCDSPIFERNHSFPTVNYRTRVRSLAMLVTHSLTHCRLVNLIDVTLVCEDGNSKLVEVVTVVDVDAEDNVGNSLLQIWDVICVWTCDMTSRGYFGKMNSTIGSVVPLAMFLALSHIHILFYPFLFYSSSLMASRDWREGISTMHLIHDAAPWYPGIQVHPSQCWYKFFAELFTCLLSAHAPYLTD